MILLWFSIHETLKFNSWEIKRAQVVKVHPIVIQNSIVDASINQFNVIQANFSYYSCFLVSKLKLYKGYTYDDFFLLLLCSDVEINPGPVECTPYSTCHPSLCAFYRIAIYMVFDQKKLLPSDEDEDIELIPPDQGINDLKSLFNGVFDIETIDFKILQKRSSKLLQKINKEWKKKKNNSFETYFDKFCPKEWVKLSDLDKAKHQINCEHCLKTNPIIVSLFPVKSKSVQEAVLKNPVNMTPKSKKQKLDKGAVACMDEVVGNINSAMKSSFNVTFDTLYCKKNNLIVKPTKEEKRSLKRSHYKEAVNEIEEKLKKTAIDRCLGSSSSLNEWERNRRKRVYETKPEAIDRQNKDQEKIRSGKKKRKDHIGPLESYEIKKDILCARALTWCETDKVNWTSLGRECISIGNRIPSNVGQVAKKFLHDTEEKGNLNFNYKGKEDYEKMQRIRPAKIRIAPKVSIPDETSANEIKYMIKEEVAQGILDIGENIVGREYEKRFYDKASGLIKTKTFTVFGRKQNLRNIRIKLFEKNKQFMRLHDDEYFKNLTFVECENILIKLNEMDFTRNESLLEMQTRLKSLERTRHLQIWHDGSVIKNHGHVVFCVNILYDPAVFFTSEEYYNKHKIQINVQRHVEVPEIYIVARCGSNDEQLAYVNTRLQDLMNLKHGLEVCDGVVLNDVMRFFHGDGPAAALEAGHQKGGYYFCPNCTIHSCQTDDITCTYQKSILSYSDKQKLVISGSFGKRNSISGNTLPFEKLTQRELRTELLSQNIDLSGLKETKKDLKPVLCKVLKGSKRVPILLLRNPITDLDDVCLKNYEISLVECMHDIAYHIDNILEELPNHLSREGDKEKFNHLLTQLNEEKQKKLFFAFSWRYFQYIFSAWY